MLVWGGVRSFNSFDAQPYRGSWSYDSVTNAWLYHGGWQPRETALQYTGAAAYNLNCGKIMYITGDRSVYVLDRERKQRKPVTTDWEDKLGSGESAYGLGAALARDTLFVFGGEKKYYYSSPDVIAVWALREYGSGFSNQSPKPVLQATRLDHGASRTTL